MGWTDERVDLLKKLWQDGLSASQVARQLGGVTRNAVIGKVHRLGLSGRAEPSRPRQGPSRTARPRRAAGRSPGRSRASQPQPRPPGGRSVPYVEPLAGTATPLTLGAHMCKWPIGDPVSESFTFCGRGALANGSYCTCHAAVAYAPRRKREADLVRALRRYIM